MDRMLVVVFDNESKAYEGKKALLQLDGEGSITATGTPSLQKTQMALPRSSKATTAGHSALLPVPPLGV